MASWSHRSKQSITTLLVILLSGTLASTLGNSIAPAKRTTISTSTPTVDPSQTDAEDWPW